MNSNIKNNTILLFYFNLVLDIAPDHRSRDLSITRVSLALCTRQSKFRKNIKIIF